MYGKAAALGTSGTRAGHAVQRYQIHKQRNVLDHLAERDRETVKRRLRRAWAEHDPALVRGDCVASSGSRP